MEAIASTTTLGVEARVWTVNREARSSSPAITKPTASAPTSLVICCTSITGKQAYRRRMMVTEREVETAARAGHYAYEAAAQENGWSTQESCQVAWDDLPEANRKTMLAAYRAALTAAERVRGEGPVLDREADVRRDERERLAKLADAKHRDRFIGRNPDDYMGPEAQARDWLRSQIGEG